MSQVPIEMVRQGLIGEDEAVAGPFGVRRVTYADYTASGRSLAFIEDFIRDDVLPFYANTHTESSGTGLQTTRFREEARALVRASVGGDFPFWFMILCASDPAVHAVVFCGSGSTSAINKLVSILNIRIPNDLDHKYNLKSHIPLEERPVVFIGPYEHHSNELPWRESIADVVTIPEDRDGRIDQAFLKAELERYASRRLKIGSFSAASNVTGIVSDCKGIARLLHQHGALSFWDFAAAAPYVPIEMSPADDPLAYKDAIFISPHKFVGGPGTPGVLVARRELFTNNVPSMPGGGTVYFVNSKEHRYISDPEHREEGGTPAIVESIRCGLVFQLKDQVGAQVIRAKEHDFIDRALKRWKQNPNIQILGSHDLERLSIVSFVIKKDTSSLHHNYVVALLNDLFGIQSRGGCSCAGPYGHRLLHVDMETSARFERLLTKGCDGIRPGWVRVNFNYFISETVFNFILDAVDLVATHGWKLLPLYRFDPVRGLWRHVDGHPEPPMSLKNLRLDGGKARYPSHRHREGEDRLAAYLDEARKLFDNPPPRAEVVAEVQPELKAEYEALRWFLLPHEVGSEGSCSSCSF